MVPNQRLSILANSQATSECSHSQKCKSLFTLLVPGCINLELVLEAGKNIENYTKTEIDVMNDLACLPYSSVIFIYYYVIFMKIQKFNKTKNVDFCRELPDFRRV